jgi:hypothetical protein
MEKVFESLSILMVLGFAVCGRVDDATFIGILYVIYHLNFSKTNK